MTRHPCNPQSKNCLDLPGALHLVLFGILLTVSIMAYGCGKDGTPDGSPHFPQNPVGSVFALDFEDNAFPATLFEQKENPNYWTTRLVKGRISFSGGTGRLSNSMSDWDGTQLTSGGIQSIAYYGYGDFEFRLKASGMSGIVTALYLYNEDRDLSAGGVHDEIDVELSSANPGKASLVVYHNAPEGLDQDDGSNRIAGGIVDIQLVSGLSNFSSTDFHSWKISYRPTEVIWHVDEILVYRLTRAIPVAKMQIHFDTYYSKDWIDFAGSLSGSGTAELDSISFTPMP